MAWPGGRWPARWFRCRGRSLSLSADHTLRPVTLGRWPHSGQWLRQASGQAGETDTATEQLAGEPEATLCEVLYCTFSFYHRMSVNLRHATLRQPSARTQPSGQKLCPLYKNLVNTFPIHHLQTMRSPGSLNTIKDTLDGLKPIERNP